MGQIERAVVNIKALVETETLILDETTDEGSGLVTVGLQHRRQSHGTGSKVLTIVPDSIRKRVGGSQQRNM